MKVFVTGGSSFVGTFVVPELINWGYEIIALSRSDESDAKLKKYGPQVETLRGDLKDLDSLKRGAAESDGVIHMAFIHDWANADECSWIDRRAVEAMCSVLEGTGKPFISTSGVLVLPDGKWGTEEDPPNPSFLKVRGDTELVVLAYKDKGVRPVSIRLAAFIHGSNSKGFVPLVGVAKEKRVSGYIGEGKNLLPVAHGQDVATLYRLVLEKGVAGRAYHGVAENVETKKIAEAIGELVGVPVESIPQEKAPEYFGYLAFFLAKDTRVSNDITRKELGWDPINPTILENIKNF